jgi:hypothetical protein
MSNQQLLNPLCLVSIFLLELPFDGCQLKLIKMLAWGSVSNLIKVWRLLGRKPIGKEENDLVLCIFEKIMWLKPSFFNVENRPYLLVGFKTVVIKPCF